jgi:cysteine dioxygenase
VIRVGSGYAALILCWQPRQASPIHDHHGSACGVRVLEGAVTEVKYARSADGKLTESGTKRYEVGRVCGSFDTDIHTIQNREKTNLVTLHIYTPPMTRYRVYSLSRAEPEWFRDVETLEAQRALAAQRA